MGKQVSHARHESLVAKKDKEIEKFDSTSESHLRNVPFHILETIMEHCFGVEYTNFRATCKLCYLAAPLARWRMYSPWLMGLENHLGIITFIDPLCGDKHSMRKPQELKGYWVIICSKYGWLLMSKPDGCELVFFNPFTRNIRKLPTTPCCVHNICFSAPPTSLDCMVVVFGQDDLYIHFVSQEPPSWRKYGLDYGANAPYYFEFPTFIGRDVYALCNSEIVCILRDIYEEDHSSEVVEVRAPTSCCISPIECFLSKCDQHLLLVIVSEFGESVEVFKLIDSSKEWKKIDGLGKHMIYISHTSCICLEAKTPEMENKIYFSRLPYKEDSKIVFYSFETCKYHTFDDKSIQESFGPNLSGTKQYCFPHTWIEPSFS